MTAQGQSTDRSLIPPGAGLCAHCQHVRVVQSARGSVFLLCGLHQTSPGFAKYPPLPVLRCRGFKPDDARSQT